MPSSIFKLNFDIAPLQCDAISARHDAIAFRNNRQIILGKIDIRAIQLEVYRNRFDSFRVGAIPQVLVNRFSVTARQTGLFRNRPDVVRFDKTGGLITSRFDACILQNSKLLLCRSAINDFPNGVGRLAFTYDSRWAYLWKTSNQFQVVSDYVAKIQFGCFPSRYHSRKPGDGFLPVRFDVVPPGLETCFTNRFDSTGCGLYLHPARKQAFVRPGWRIIAKNISTEEVHDLGFIDTESQNPALEGIFLPDGDYEVSVLTSSLFWKDASDFDVRLLSIRPGEEVSSLPTIYNLRSSISQGETTIYWSASPSDVEDCVFGVWYSAHSPVPTDDPPTETVWYFSEMSEYQASFRQNSPCYVAVAAMRPGDEPEIGKVHELFLDWKSTPPRAPDDVVLFDKLPPVIDVNVIENKGDENLTLWF